MKLKYVLDVAPSILYIYMNGLEKTGNDGKKTI